MVKVIKLAACALSPTMRSGAHERVAAVWGIEVNGNLVARIFTRGWAVLVLDAETGRLLHAVYTADRRQSRVSIAKAWAVEHFSGVAA